MAKRTALRIIAGTLGGLRLKSPPGTITRPITDRVKENLFNIIRFDIGGKRFLDLFAGTGSVGIEAYSRGAKFVQFIEKNHQPFSFLKNNLDLIPDKNSYALLKTDAFNFIESYHQEPFDYIFIAPPQYKNMWKKTLKLIDNKIELLSVEGMLLVQIDPQEYEELNLQYFSLIDQRRYGSTLLLFYKINT